MPEVHLRSTRDRRLADDWSLVLATAGIPNRVYRAGFGFALSVQQVDVSQAEELLATWDRENPPRVQPEPVVELAGPTALNPALAVATAMLLFYTVTGPRDPDVSWFAHGSADAHAIRAGEIWRCITALCLHADLAHLVANLVSGTFFLTLLGRSLGPGFALALAVTAGGCGNLENAILRSGAHSSVGASTAVFGAVGALCGLGVARRLQRGEGARRAWLPLAAGLGLLAMLGTAGDRVDLWAHFFGLASGVLPGAALGLGIRRPPRAIWQWSLGAAAVCTLIGCWWLALS